MGHFLITVAHFFGATTVSPDGYAYWAQAIATVAAIVVTMILAIIQGGATLRRRARDRRNVKLGLVRLAEHVADGIDRILEGSLEAAVISGDVNSVREMKAAFVNYSEVLHSVSLGDLAKADVVWPAVIFRKCIKDVEHVLSNCDAASFTMPRETTQLLKAIRTKIMEMRQRIAA